MAKLSYNGGNDDSPLSLAQVQTKFQAVTEISQETVKKPEFVIEMSHETVHKPVFTTVEQVQRIEKPVFRVKEVVQHIEKPVYDSVIDQCSRLASDIEHIRLNIPHIPAVKYVERVPTWVWPLLAALSTAAAAGWLR